MSKSILTFFLNIFICFYLSMALFNAAWSHGVSHKASSTILSPQNGARLSNPFLVKFGIEKFMVAPAGKNIHKAGHFHLLIDLYSELSMDDPIPYNEHHRHFDNGETEVLLSLSPGRHTLQLVVGDEEHEPFEQLVSEKITIEVTE